MIDPITRTTKTRTRRRQGFSLAETMIAIGILGIGMAMSASVFPAALRETQRTTNTQVGLMICENALTMARCILRKPDVPSNANPAVKNLLESAYSARFGGGFVYPVSDVTGGGKFAFGYLLFGKFKTDDLRTLIAVAYRKSADTATVGAYVVDGVTASGRKISTSGANKHLRTNSAVINTASGEFAVIVSGDGTRGVLDRPLTIAGGSVYAVAEVTAGVFSDLSPAIAILSLDAGLRD